MSFATRSWRWDHHPTCNWGRKLVKGVQLPVGEL